MQTVLTLIVRRMRASCLAPGWAFAIFLAAGALLRVTSGSNECDIGPVDYEDANA